MKYIKKIKKLFRSPRAFINDSLIIKVFKNKNTIYKNTIYKNEPVQLIGSNWIDNPDFPIAIFVGFNPWKRDIFTRFFPQYRTCFVLGKASWKRVEKDFINKYNLLENNKLVIIRWGHQDLPISLKIWIKTHKTVVDLFSIEDGFLRSLDKGVIHTRPASICIDKKTIYFNANQESEIENILKTYNFSNDKLLMERAHKIKNLINATALTKYYNINTASSTKKEFTRKKNYSILVIGQVEDDASIKYGKSQISLNTELVKAARKEYPDADIYFRPHPDYINNNRKSISNINEIKNIAAIVSNETILSSILDNVDHVFTMTSLVGFEALIRGLKVTTYGVPFYSGWGLTDDKVTIPRRNRKLTIDELIAGSLILYPKYLHLNSDEFISYEETAGYFIFELLKEKNLFTLNEKSQFYINAKKHIKNLSVPLDILNYLIQTKTFANADLDIFMSIILKKFNLVDYIQISELLIKTSNYDILVEYSNYCIKYLNQNIKSISKNTTLLNEFLYSLSLALRNSSGRVLSKLNNFSSEILNISVTDKKQVLIIKNYLTCCSYNLQYEEINSFINKINHQKQINLPEKNYWTLSDYIQDINHFTPSIETYKLITNILSSKPSRSERNIHKRYNLTHLSASKFLALLDEKYNGPFDIALNYALYYQLLQDYKEVEKNLNNYIKIVTTKKLLTTLTNTKRLGHFISLCSLLLKKKRFKIIDEFLLENKNFKENEKYAFFILTYYKIKEEKQSFYNYYNGLSNELKESTQIATLFARTLREEGKFSASLKKYKELISSARTLARKKNLNDEKAKLTFIIESSQILNSIAQPKFPKGVVFIASQTCFNTMAMMLPSLVELKKMGYAVINLTAGMIEKAPTGYKYLDDFEGIIPLSLTLSGSVDDLKNSWEVDWKNKKVINNGVNYYQGFYEGLSVTVRRFHVDINNKNISDQFYANLLRADTCLYVCKKIYSEIVEKTNLPVTFISGNSHVTPYSIFRDFAMNKNHDRLGYINCNVAYESYFSNVGSKFASTMAVTDMTLYPTVRAPFMARKDKFELWYDKNKDNEKYLKIAENQIKVNRVGNTSNKKELEIIKFLEEKKQQGKTIICAFGKVPVDLNVPYDGGPAHTDMADWITHTVEICNKSKDIILLVKPHPHELKPEIALDLVESFHDLIDTEINDNVILLGHRDINGHSLAPYLDLAVLYNGSTALELTAQGIPVILTSYFGKFDYPLDLIYPSDRIQYEEYLLSCKYETPSLDTRKKSAFLLSYLGTDDVSTLNQYSLRQLTNDKIGIPKWNKELIEDFLLNGDLNMKKIANQIVEKFT